MSSSLKHGSCFFTLKIITSKKAGQIAMVAESKPNEW
jgi:hypothetical protein